MRFLLVIVILMLAGCASLPNGPSVMVLPGQGQSFDQFQADNVTCQQFASFEVGGATANSAATESGLASAAVGTVVGAAAGAAFAGGSGAAIGAGSGLLAGSLIGTSNASRSQYGTQHHYDVAYIQCMYAKGHQVPVSGQFSNPTPAAAATTPPPPPPSAATLGIPPPPPGSPPPPPPH